MFDLIIIGAGPAGIAAAYEAKNHNLSYLVIEKGLIGNTVYNYPVGLTVFSTINELEITPGGLKPAREKPTREELLSYYVRFVLENELNIHTEEMVISVSEATGEFTVTTAKNQYKTKNQNTKTNKRAERAPGRAAAPHRTPVTHRPTGS